MKCLVLKQYRNRGELLLPGSITDVPEDMYSKMDGFVQVIVVADNYSNETGVAHGFCNYIGICSISIDKCTGSFPETCQQMKCEHLSGIRTCRCCKGTDFWESAVQEDHSVCRRCHPPAPEAELIKR